jgi:hypothetical protein
VAQITSGVYREIWLGYIFQGRNAHIVRLMAVMCHVISIPVLGQPRLRLCGSPSYFLRSSEIENHDAFDAANT